MRSPHLAALALLAMSHPKGQPSATFVARVANEDSVVGALEQVSADFGRLDGLINNAGIVRDALLVKVKDGRVVGKMTLAQWQAVIDVNLTGVFLCAREAAQHMIDRAVGGVIVNVSSISRAGNATSGLPFSSCSSAMERTTRRASSFLP